ncbi:hypothetical protein PHLCEN_2v11499 [Hermanssonia centrifuga]|uniref:Uncharacterized protein n=1 Tax=Hermanssonia centrifuga TaxID=98765 RepID=A0A2R6NJR0_9APHY|nr:hypothetical protein PHLCEN_2v11499 [Hermanssonia centrifuga]
MASSYIIDDFFGDQGTGLGAMPIYSPASSSTGPNQWDIEGGTCTGCSAQGAGFKVPIDPSQVHSGTWKSTTMDPGEPLTTLSVQFYGSSITMYCLLPPDLGPWTTSAMNLTFVLDGEQVGTYDRPSGTGDAWTYQGQVFKSDWLDGHLHTLVVALNAPTLYPPWNSSFIAFDNFLIGSSSQSTSGLASSQKLPASGSSSQSSYNSNSSFPSPSTASRALVPSGTKSPNQHSPTPVPPPHKVQTGPIAGAVAGVIIFVICLCTLLYWMRRQKPVASGKRQSVPLVTPFLVSPREVPAGLVSSPRVLEPGMFPTSVPSDSMHTQVGSGSLRSAAENERPPLPSSSQSHSLNTPIPPAQSHSTASREDEIRAEVNMHIRREILELRAQLEEMRVLREREAPPTYEDS